MEGKNWTSEVMVTKISFMDSMANKDSREHDTEDIVRTPCITYQCYAFPNERNAFLLEMLNFAIMERPKEPEINGT